MSRIRRIRARNVGFSRAPTTLRRNLVSNASLFEDFESKPGGWFGSVFCTLVEVETEDGAVGVGTAGAFGGAAKPIVEQYLADLVVGLDCRAHEALWQRMYRTLVRFGRRGPAVTALSTVDMLSGGADVVFHLASMVSGEAELDFDGAVRVNLDGTRNVLEACRALGTAPIVVFTSTVAVFGGAGMPPEVSDETKPTPQTTYGATKAACELLVNDYTRKGFVDGRTARLPTVAVRPGAPNAAASSFASAVVREPLSGRDYALPVALETRMPLIGARTAVECLVRLAELDGASLGEDRGVNLPSISVTVAEMIESVERVAASRPLGRIVLAPDAAVERIVATWPAATAFARAAALGLTPASTRSCGSSWTTTSTTRRPLGTDRAR